MTGGGPDPAGTGFERIAIVGLGLIGASIALGIRKGQPGAAIAGVDAADVLGAAVARGLVDTASERLEVVEGAGLVVLAAPVEQNIELVRLVSRHVSPDTLVTDVSSTKRAIEEAARGASPPLTFIGGHPLAGAASGGMVSAAADLFVGRRWVLTPDAGTPPAMLSRLCRFVRALGAEPHLMDAAGHDRVLAFTSHLPQLVASALMRTVGEGVGASGLAISGPGLADTTRLAGSPFDVWRGICLTNADNILAALDRFIAAMGDMRGHASDPPSLQRVFSDARAWRKRLAAAGGPAAAGSRRTAGDG